ncbi:DNA adenine methylase [Bacteroides thetaiotaomicron]|nr:DNA adenine methylase [Bacteroides thetaiotaomicron]MCS3264580.1 DNA adenine methylase [Bacteroides thetaiotaomicron]
MTFYDRFSKIATFNEIYGIKRELLDFIISSINDLDIESNWFCDLFSGTSVVGCSLKDEYNVQINDIQIYTSIFANTYLPNINKLINSTELEKIKDRVLFYVDEFYRKYPDLIFDYNSIDNYEKLTKLEIQQQNLIYSNFEIGFHLFVKYYSGTYWSYTQCVWIDSIRAVAEEYKGKSDYYIILSSLIYAMSYTSQSTGHFAQFRDVTESNMHDIMLYRIRDIWTYFEKKFLEILNMVDVEATNRYTITTLDYLDCLRLIERNTIVYADPPYSSVHYSRFYHAIETLIRYDYPNVKYKGRYREDRHQSPFGKKTEVKNAFGKLFKGVKNKNSHLILSYSDNGMITQDEIMEIGNSIMGNQYKGDIQVKEYIHSKMGRSDIHSMGVNELIISYKRQ